MPTRYIYTGDGRQAVAGVSTRNLSQADYDALTDDQKKAVQQSDLFRPAKGDEARASADEDPSQAAAGGGRIVRLPYEGYMAPDYARKALEVQGEKPAAAAPEPAGSKKAGE